MSTLERLSRRHILISKLSAALFYALAVAIALNFFWNYWFCPNFTVCIRTIFAIYISNIGNVFCTKYPIIYFRMV